MDLFFRSWPLLVKGAQLTLVVMMAAAVLSFTLGLVFGALSSHRLRIRWLSNAIEALTFVHRAVPFYVQLLITYYVLPALIGCNLDPLTASILSLGVCSSGYTAQIIRAGINAIPAAQWDAAFALGYNKWQALRAIIFPQMIRNVLPMLTNECDSLLKSSAIVSSIGLLELTRAGMNLVSQEMEPIPIYLMVALFYLVLSALFNQISQILERKLSYVRN